MNIILQILPEQLSKEKTVDFVQRYEDCFERALTCGHITGSAWLISKDGTKALLTHHNKLDKWLQLGGHCDGDSDVLAVAIKVAQEESGITQIKPLSTGIFDLDVHLLPESKHHQAHYHYDVRFLLQVQSDEQVVVSDESKALKWITKDRESLPSNTSSIMRMFEKWRALDPGESCITGNTVLC